MIQNRAEELKERIAIKMYHGNIHRRAAERQAKCEVYPLKDENEMPFGRYQHKRMDEVPTYYFHWLFVEGKADDMECPVAGYIRRNIKVLKKDKPDLIWEKKKETTK